MTPEHPSDPPRTIVTVDGQPVAITDEGAGVPLLAIHGGPGSVRDWRWLAPAITESCRLVRLDLPGFGETPLAAFPDPSFEGRRHWFIRLLAAMNIERCAVIGHSIGGAMAIDLAANAPEHIAGLALVASVGVSPHRPYREHPVGRRLAGLLRIPGMATLLTPGLRRGFERTGFPSGLPGPSLVQTMRFVGQLNFAQNRANVARVAVPTFVAWAENDRFIEADISEELSEALRPGVRLSFPSGGHNLQKTQAVELGAALGPWVAGLTGPRTEP